MNKLYLLIIAILVIIIVALPLRKDDTQATEGLIDMEVTAYCPCEICCGEFADGITASGIPIGRGTKLVAAPPEYPFGTRMKIPGYGLVPVLDRGGAIKGNKLDVLFQSHQEALEWGRQYLKVRILK